MRWYRTASTHGDTYRGALLGDKRAEVAKGVSTLRAMASAGTIDVMPRWFGELRRRMLLLPPANRVARMSMMELNDLSGDIRAIMADMDKYATARWANGHP